MDNIQKMLLGVLSVAGLIALVVPEKNPLPPSVAEMPADAPTLSPEDVPPPPSPDPAPVQFGSDPVSDFQIGEPAIDGNPIQSDFGQPFGTSAQSDSANPDAGQTAQGGFTPPVYEMPGMAPQIEAPNADSGMSDQ